MRVDQSIDLPIGSAAAPPRPPIGNYAWYVLFVLSLIQALGVTDRLILSVLIEDIKRDFYVSDTQIGLLNGIAFAGLYSVAALFVARFADRVSRKKIIAFSVALWSLFAGSGGFAVNLTQLFISRIGLSLGEAGGAAPAHALVPDYFPPHKRAFAMGILASGSTLGIFALAVSGFIADRLGWRAALFAVGSFGLIISMIVLATVREPRRSGGPATIGQARLGASIHTLMQLRSYRWVVLGATFHVSALAAIATFLPAYLIRAHGASAGSAGMFVAMASGLAGLIGSISGGAVADRLSKRNKAWMGLVPACALLLAALLSSITLLAASAASMSTLAILMFATTLCAWLSVGPGYATVQQIVPNGLRAFAAAVLLFMTNGLGSSIGPYLTGLLSDCLHASYGPQALSVALLLVSPICWLVGAACYYVASRRITQDLV